MQHAAPERRLALNPRACITRLALSSKCGFATLLDPHGGRPASAFLEALRVGLTSTDIKPLCSGRLRVSGSASRN